LTTLQQRLVKTGGRLINQAGYYRQVLAEGHLTRRLFGATLFRIAAPLSFNRANISRRSLLPRTMTTSVINVKADPATTKLIVQK
jgi:hypothetical protein